MYIFIPFFCQTLMNALLAPIIAIQMQIVQIMLDLLLALAKLDIVETESLAMVGIL